MCKKDLYKKLTICFFIAIFIFLCFLSIQFIFQQMSQTLQISEDFNSFMLNHPQLIIPLRRFLIPSF